MLGHAQTSVRQIGIGNNPIRVLVVDDSVVARTVFSRVLGSSSEIDVVATAATADEALQFLARQDVDIILLDIEMPDRSGIEALPEIVAQSDGARVIIVSSFVRANGPAAMEALALGACDTIAKPGSSGASGRFSELLVKSVLRLGRPKRALAAPNHTPTPPKWAFSRKPECIAIGASTGGIPVCYQLVSALPQSLQCPVLITQHLPAVFMDFFARQLAALTDRRVSVATSGYVAQPNEILLAPGDANLICRKAQGRVIVDLIIDHSASRYCPSVDILFGSVAKMFGDAALGIVLSGMGNDGAEGAHKIRERGGAILVQDEESSVVWGMPGAVVRRNCADAILTPSEIAEQLGQAALL